MARGILKRLLALALGVTPGAFYYASDMVGMGGAIFLIVLGGAVGLAFTLPTVSPRRVINGVAEITPLAWPLAMVVEAYKQQSSPSDPSEKVIANPEWLTFNVLALARTIRASGDVGLLPILGDALMDAGCTDEDLLEHCRAAEYADDVIELLLGADDSQHRTLA